MKGYNCPNCGAPITGDKCEYCGTVFRPRETETIEIEHTLFADGEIFATATQLLEIGVPPNDIRRAAGLPPLNERIRV